MSVSATDGVTTTHTHTNNNPHKRKRWNKAGDYELWDKISVWEKHTRAQTRSLNYSSINGFQARLEETRLHIIIGGQNEIRDQQPLIQQRCRTLPRLLSLMNPITAWLMHQQAGIIGCYQVITYILALEKLYFDKYVKWNNWEVLYFLITCRHMC